MSKVSQDGSNDARPNVVSEVSDVLDSNINLTLASRRSHKVNEAQTHD